MANENLSEKVSVNINSSTLSNIDLLVDNGYFSNRSDFINQALRESLQKHQNTLDRIIDRNLADSREKSLQWFIGVYGLTKETVEKYSEGEQPMGICGYGVLGIDEDVDEEKLFAGVKYIKVKGKVICNRRIKEHYGIR